MIPARRLVVLTGCFLAAAPALAQAPSPGPTGVTEPGTAPAGAVGSTIDGGLPERAGSTSAVGRTKPPGATVGDQLGTRPDLEAKSRDLSRRIETGICSGCR